MSKTPPCLGKSKGGRRCSNKSISSLPTLCWKSGQWFSDSLHEPICSGQTCMFYSLLLRPLICIYSLVGSVKHNPTNSWACTWRSTIWDKIVLYTVLRRWKSQPTSSTSHHCEPARETSSTGVLGILGTPGTHVGTPMDGFGRPPKLGRSARWAKVSEKFWSQLLEVRNVDPPKREPNKPVWTWSYNPYFCTIKNPPPENFLGVVTTVFLLLYKTFMFMVLRSKGRLFHPIYQDRFGAHLVRNEFLLLFSLWCLRWCGLSVVWVLDFVDSRGNKSDWWITYSIGPCFLIIKLSSFFKYVPGTQMTLILVSKRA